MSIAPQISVILPCYNAHQFLPRALGSLRAQKFRNFEIIVVDDGSTDLETIAYLNSMPDDIKLVRQENRGTAAARNRGFREARAAYVLPLDCDDWIASDFLSDAHQKIRAAPDRSFVFPDRTLEGEMTGVRQQTYNFFEQLHFNQLPYCMLIPRTAWLEVGGYNEKMRGYEDWEFSIRLGRRGYTGVPLGKPYLHYQVSAAGKLASESRLRHIELWRFIKGEHREAYTPTNLISCWWTWRNKKAAFPLVLYFLWELLSWVIPDRMMTMLFRVSRPALYTRYIAQQIRSGIYASQPASPYTRLMHLASAPLVILAAVFSRLAAYIILIIAARILAPDEFGLFAVLTVVGGIINAVVSGGGDMWLNRFTTQRSVAQERPPRLWIFYVVISLTISILGMAITWLACTTVPILHGYADAIVIAIGAFCVAGIAEALFAVMRASGRVIAFFVLRDLITPVALLVALILYRPNDAIGLFGIYFSIWLAVGSMLATYIFFVARWEVGMVKMRMSLVLPTLKHTLFLVATNLCARALSYLDVLSLLFYVGLADIGEYRAAAQFAVGYFVVQHFIFLSLPYELRDGGDKTNRKLRYQRLRDRQGVLVALSFVTLIVALVGAEWFLSILGAHFTEVANIFRILFMIRFLELLWGPQHELLVSNGLVRLDVGTNLVGIAVWIFVFVVSHLWYDPIMAVIIATAISAHSAHAIRATILLRYAISCPRLVPLPRPW